MTLWIVLRADTAGNMYIVKDKLTKESADTLVETMTNRGHHQTYTAHAYEPGERTTLLEKYRVHI